MNNDFNRPYGINMNNTGIPGGNDYITGTGIGGIAPSQTTTLVPSGEDDEVAIRLQMQLMF